MLPSHCDLLKVYLSWLIGEQNMSVFQLLDKHHLTNSTVTQEKLLTGQYLQRNIFYAPAFMITCDWSSICLGPVKMTSREHSYIMIEICFYCIIIPNITNHIINIITIRSKNNISHKISWLVYKITGLHCHISHYYFQRYQLDAFIKHSKQCDEN